MWLYRAYSGNLYHNGEQTLTLSSFTQGDFITCVLDMEARTISFGKNGEVNAEFPNTNCKITNSLCLTDDLLLDRNQSWHLRMLTPQSFIHA